MVNRIRSCGGRTLLRPLLISLLTFSDGVFSKLVVEDIAREVDLSSQFVRITDDVKLRNGEDLQLQQYTTCFPGSAAKNLAHLEVVEAGDDDDDLPALSVAPVVLEGQPVDVSCWTAQLHRTLLQGKITELEVYATFTKLQRPFPDSVSQAEAQRVLYEGSAYVLSPYHVTSQTTQVKLPNRRVESWTKHGPSTLAASKIKYGPYQNTPPFTAAAIRLHYENNSPFIEVMRLDREIEVSHWGNIYVEERYELKHSGAKHQGAWSRLEFMQDPARNAPAMVRDLRALLPPSARWLYFKDDIGNVSTSAVRFGLDAVEVQLLPRYPLLGGWKVQFTFGYSLPLKAFAARLPGGRRQLKLKLSTPIQGVVVEDLVLKVVLPEGASDFRADTPFPMETSSTGRKFSYLDTSGRPVLTLRKSNLVPENEQDFTLTYQMSPLATLWEPLYLAVAVMTAFGGVIAYVRCEFTISRDSKWAAEQVKQKLLDLTTRLQTLLSGRTAAMAILEDTDAAAWNFARQTAEAALHDSDSELRKLAAEFSQLPGFQGAAEVASLLESERSLQASAMQLSSQRVSLLNQGLDTQDISSRLGRQEDSLAERQQDVVAQLEALTTGI